ncbi:precorrin-6A synthase (deacetylating) [Comamonas piscis]|uniref:Precorrin-6A synthase (Deacetylating) n=1 Tax=Comamonas piscis TaxID=1562974 RepID=A0A7G5EED2_9BURK|nr:precorrin-6A synthase (deacetylating) [Comamonas piscis]QMV72357.1 precorrin-6A synthase (deacetylating) [Comamonas piscis]WSO35124.1 precorrin-6A synthase (deacetylating) [Comamonas piscis]
MSNSLPPVALSLIGIGTGNPDHLTRQAIAAMNAADLLLLPHKGDDKAELAALRQSLCDAVLQQPGALIAGFDMPERRSQGDDYLNQVDEWHAAITLRWQAAIAQALESGLAPRAGNGVLQVALLVWGDPSLYDSTLRIAARMQPAPVQVKVIAGITSMQALTAAHAIAVNDIGQPFTVTTGRQLREQGWPAGVDTLVVMLDGQCSFNSLPAEQTRGVHIWWGAYLGMAQQCLEHGPLAEAAERIVATRAAARAQHGWIMDIYLLRRTPGDQPPTQSSAG